MTKRNRYADDIRYMSHEQRIREGYMKAPTLKSDVPELRTCKCGKTVVEARGVPTGWTCPRFCHLPVEDRPTVRVP